MGASIVLDMTADVTANATWGSVCRAVFGFHLPVACSFFHDAPRAPEEAEERRLLLVRLCGLCLLLLGFFPGGLDAIDGFDLAYKKTLVITVQC